MSEASWQTMMREFPAAHVVTGLLPREDAAVGLAEGRSSLLRRLTGTIACTGMYAIAEIVERDGTHIQCALASASDADQLAEAVGANDIGCHSCWASRRRFLFDDAPPKRWSRRSVAVRQQRRFREAASLWRYREGGRSNGALAHDKEMVETLSLRRRRRPPPRALSLLRRDIRYPRLLARCWCTTTTRSPLARRLPLTSVAKKASRPRLATSCRCDAAGKVRLVD